MAMTLSGTTGIVLPTGAAPAFSAYRTATQSIASSTWTKIQYNLEEFDTANCYDSTTNYRFTPNVAGYYQISAGWNNNNNSTWNYISIYKNGSSYKMAIANGTNGVGVNISVLIYFNGTTDYVEAYAVLDGGVINSGSTNTTFTGVLVRSA